MGNFCHSLGLFFFVHVPAIVFLLLYTGEMEPRLFYDSHNHHPWRLHRDISSNRLLRGTPRCQIKVSGWRSVGEQRGSVCRISTSKPQCSSMCNPLPLVYLFNDCRPRWMLWSQAAHTLSFFFFDSRDFHSKSVQNHTINHNSGSNKWLGVTNACGQCALGAATQHLVWELHTSWLYLIKNRSVHWKARLIRDGIANICFCRWIGKFRSYRDKHIHNDRQGFSLLCLNVTSSSSSNRLKRNRIEHLHDLIYWLAPLTQDVMWKFKKRDLRSLNALLQTSRDFYFPDGFDIHHSGVTTKACFPLFRLFKSFTS